MSEIRKWVFLALGLGAALVILSTADMGFEENWVGFLALIALMICFYMYGFYDGVKMTKEDQREGRNIEH